MKYIVELKYTNPAHEHVSLRRRVESRNAIVEAANEEEAILRASRQQRALGFLVKEAKIVEQKSLTEQVESVDEASRFNPDGSPKGPPKKTVEFGKKQALKTTLFHLKRGLANDDMSKFKAPEKEVKEEVEQIDEVNEKQIKKDLDSGMSHDAVIGKHANKKLTNTDAIRKVIKQHAWNKRMKKEEVESVDEASPMIKPPVNRFDSLGDAKKHRDANAPGKKIQKMTYVNPRSGMKDVYYQVKMKEEVEYVEEKLTAADPASKWISDFVKSDNPKFAGKSKKERIRMALGAHYAAKREKNEEVDPDKREAGYKMSPAVRAAQKKSDELSKVKKPVQAGTLAAKVKMEETERKESKKKLDAAKKAINSFKGKKNKINMEPEMEPVKGIK